METANRKTNLPNPPQDFRGKRAVLMLLACGALIWIALPAGPSGEFSRLALWRAVAIIVAAIIGLLPGARQ